MGTVAEQWACDVTLIDRGIPAVVAQKRFQQRSMPPELESSYQSYRDKGFQEVTAQMMTFLYFLPHR